MASRFDVIGRVSRKICIYGAALVFGLLDCIADARAAAVVETRHFTVSVDGKDSGELHMTITKQEDGTQTMQCDTKITRQIPPHQIHIRLPGL